ncbi:unnamed protein product [Ambrosiozyma monospora]|uniref:Origin recognition complex subunit 2 n=1 Tax=Ambrosiozyma monospora TaxID=43982 RepID=A0A9W6Z207_AMBMO|nr:unnamed protein product [Ambrosiozyma monospora]
MTSPTKSPFKGLPSGRLGLRSPRKKRILDDISDDGHFLKLRSPMKRSMQELNQTAIKKTLNLKFRNLANEDYDEDSDDERTLADMIIEESKKDGLGSLHFEDSSDEDQDQEDEDLQNNDNAILHTDVVSSKRDTPSTAFSKMSLVSTPRKNNPFMTTPSSSPSKRRITTPNISPLKQDILKPSHPVKLMSIPKVSKDKDILLNFGKNESGALFCDGYEGFFEQHRIKTKKLSTKTMSLAPDLNYDEFHLYNKLIDLICDNQSETLSNYYRNQFSQWWFELQEGFSLIFYGAGSKRLTILEFVQNFMLGQHDSQNTKALVVNGYNSEFTVKSLIKSIWEIAFNKRSGKSGTSLYEQIHSIATQFAKPSSKKLILLVNNIDGESLRSDQAQYLLSELSTIPKIQFICTMDNVNTPFLWNATLLTNFNFVWHNISTYSPYNTETSFKDPLSIGKSKRFVGSKGVKYVLNSLTSNGRNLYKNLITQQLEKIDSSITTEKEMENRASCRGNVKNSLDFKDFYNLCVGEFICSNEISFRTLLREFLEHKSCTLTTNQSGTEVLFVPFTVDEMEKILEEEFMDG